MIAFFWSTYLPALRKSDMYLGRAARYGNIAAGVCSHGNVVVFSLHILVWHLLGSCEIWELFRFLYLQRLLKVAGV